MGAIKAKERALLLKRGGLSDDVICGVLGLGLSDVHRLLFEDDPDLEFLDDALRVARTVFSHEQIKALPTTRVAVVPDPGSGKAIHVVHCALTARIINLADRYSNLNLNSAIRFYTAQTGGAETGMTISNSINSQLLDDLFASNSDDGIGGNNIFVPPAGFLDLDFGPQPNQESRGSDVDNRGVYMGLYNAADGNLTGGNPQNTLIVQTLYSVIDLA